MLALLAWLAVSGKDPHTIRIARHRGCGQILTLQHTMCSEAVTSKAPRIALNLPKSRRSKSHTGSGRSARRRG